MAEGRATDELVPVAGAPTSTGEASWNRVAVADEEDERRKGANALNEVRRGRGDEGEVGAVMMARLELAAAVAVESLGSSGAAVLVPDTANWCPTCDA